MRLPDFAEPANRDNMSMAQPLLTIAIPTYNRADRLDEQLRHLTNAVRSAGADVEFFISDNCSTDHTTAVLSRWQNEIPTFVARRNERNVGALPNIALCIHAARGRFVWVVGDDDIIHPETPAFILRTLRFTPELASVLLNFNSVGKTVFDRCYDFTSDETRTGRSVIEQCLVERYHGLAFMTAHVYRTALAQAALLAWPDGTRNFDFQLFITAYCAWHGAVRVTRDPRVTYVTGNNCYETDPVAAMRLSADTSSVMVRLLRLGYSRKVVSQLVRKHARRFGPRFWKRAAGRPLKAPPIVFRYLRSLTLVHLLPAYEQSIRTAHAHESAPPTPFRQDLAATPAGD